MRNAREQRGARERMHDLQRGRMRKHNRRHAGERDGERTAKKDAAEYVVACANEARRQGGGNARGGESRRSMQDEERDRRIARENRHRAAERSLQQAKEKRNQREIRVCRRIEPRGRSSEEPAEKARQQRIEPGDAARIPSLQPPGFIQALSAEKVGTQEGSVKKEEDPYSGLVHLAAEARHGILPCQRVGRRPGDEFPTAGARPGIGSRVRRVLKIISSRHIFVSGEKSVPKAGST